MNKPLESLVASSSLRTLPISLCRGVAGEYGGWGGSFHANVFVLCLLTAIGLQILSNLANDYGDAVSGADNDDRVGPNAPSSVA